MFFHSFTSKYLLNYTTVIHSGPGIHSGQNRLGQYQLRWGRGVSPVLKLIFKHHSQKMKVMKSARVRGEGRNRADRTNTAETASCNERLLVCRFREEWLHITTCVCYSDMVSALCLLKFDASLKNI